MIVKIVMKMMMSKIKLIYDFFRLWIHWGDRKEAWQDARFINDKKIQKELREFDEKLVSVDPEIQKAMNEFRPSDKPKKDRFGDNGIKK